MSIPPTMSLIALETLDRLGSVKATATKLNLTQSAVSHRLKTLEHRLGFPLTLPSGRSVVLSSQARQYVQAIRPALAALTAAHQSVSTASGRLKVNSASGFAAYWLAPRLSEFLHLYPDIQLQMKTAGGYGDLGERSDDIYITFAEPETVPNTARLLLKASYFPVCSPGVVHGSNRKSPAFDLTGQRLLHLNDYSDWHRYFAQLGVSAELAHSGVIFDDMQTMLAAAVAGEGICLGDTLTCAAALNSGILARPSVQEIASARAYFVLAGAGGLSSAAAAFQDWLFGEV